MSGGVDAVSMAQASKQDGAQVKAQVASQGGSASGQASNAPAKASQYGLVSLSQFSKGTQQAYYLKGLCPRSGLGQIMGESGVCKSFVALDMAYALAIGRNWFKWTYSRTARRNLPLVVYLVLEGAGGFRLRVQALLKREKKNPDNSNPEPDNFVLCDEPFNIMQTMDRDALIWSILDRAGERGVVLFVDTQAQCMGALDENSAQDMGAFLKCVEEIQRRIGKARDCFVWLIAHMGKSGDAKKGSRGWSGQKAPMDMQIVVENKNKVRSFTLVKNKDGMDGITCFFILQGMPLGKDMDGDEVSSCTVEQSDVENVVNLTDKQQDGLRWLKAAYAKLGKTAGEAITMDAWREACAEELGLEKTDKQVHNLVNRRRAALQREEIIACGSSISSDVILLEEK